MDIWEFVRDMRNRAIAKARVWTGDRIEINAGGTTGEFAAPRVHSSLQKIAKSETRIINEWVDDVTNDCLTWDVGAELGIYSVLAALQGAEVHAFEPRGDLAAKTREHLQLNGVSVDVHQIALCDHDETPTDWLRKNCPGAELVNADQVARELGAPDILKVDIEGGELKFLRGFENTLIEAPPRTVFIELHPIDGHSQPGVGLTEAEIDEVYERLNSSGYKIQEIAQRDAQQFLKASRSKN